MGISIDISVILAYAFGLLLLYIVGWLLVMVKFLLSTLYNGIIGGIMLGYLTWWRFFNVQVAINPVTALIAGFGNTRCVLILILQYIL